MKVSIIYEQLETDLVDLLRIWAVWGSTAATIRRGIDIRKFTQANVTSLYYKYYIFVPRITTVLSHYYIYACSSTVFGKALLPPYKRICIVGLLTITPRRVNGC